MPGTGSRRCLYWPPTSATILADFTAPCNEDEGGRKIEERENKIRAKSQRDVLMLTSAPGWFKFRYLHGVGHEEFGEAESALSHPFAAKDCRIESLRQGSGRRRWQNALRRDVVLVPWRCLHIQFRPPESSQRSLKGKAEHGHRREAATERTERTEGRRETASTSGNTSFAKERYKHTEETNMRPTTTQFTDRGNHRSTATGIYHNVGEKGNDKGSNQMSRRMRRPGNNLTG
ncbi:hypothetical protein B0H16DRAFT_1692865 [Mycena metata]|uniref:Uncharacterized protein n=1 Tax=Mycena metata TaxID=1033252 RepID=A0AAD7IP60_9AGAR|nr:hypothetical protein B0H16DRAFT_1692865 [Mycena metata]